MVIYVLLVIILHFKLNSSHMCSSKALFKFAKLKYSSSISMIYGGSDNKEPKNLEVSINRSHLKKIKSLTEKIENVINDNYQDDLFKGQNDDKSILVGALSNILEKKIFKNE